MLIKVDDLSDEERIKVEEYIEGLKAERIPAWRLMVDERAKFYAENDWCRYHGWGDNLGWVIYNIALIQDGGYLQHYLERIIAVCEYESGMECFPRQNECPDSAYGLIRWFTNGYSDSLSSVHWHMLGCHAASWLEELAKEK